jgi:uncharacterized protein YbjT (DUF2867 family)
MIRKILVTGATGNVGSCLIPMLASRSECSVTAMTRDPDKGKELFSPEVQIVGGNFEDDASLAVAMRGIDTVILMAPPNPDCVAQNRAVINEASLSGVDKVVRISAIKAAEDGRTENTRLHGECDTLLQKSGLTFTILRPNYFMQNIMMSLESINADNCFYAGMGDGRLAMIDTRDVAESAAASALSDQFNGEILEISGPQSISFNDVAAVLSDLTGRQISYVAVSPDDVKASLLQMGFGEWMANLLREYSEAYGEGWGDLVTDNVQRLSGHPPRSFKQFATECLASLLN